MTEIQETLAEINARSAPVLEECPRLQCAAAKAITLILTMAAVGVLTVICAGLGEQQLKTSALINQEQITWQK